jgi:hypothetical protein
MKLIYPKSQAIAAFLLVCAVATAHSEPLIVEKNQVINISGEKLLVERLVMEDGSKIIIESREFELHALSASFGRNVEIIAIGSPGKTGANGENIPGQAGYCEKGTQGGNGSAGSPGKDGANISITVGLESLGSLKIDASGGKGGNGGNGGNGQTGGVAKGDYTCHGGDGGDGGNGGDGGGGGKGGNVTFKYWNMLDMDAIKALKSTQAGAALLDKFTVGLDIVNNGGTSGTGGAPGFGAGGGGGRRKCVLKVCVSRGSGNAGAMGQAGAVPRAGVNGTKTITPLPKP